MYRRLYLSVKACYQHAGPPSKVALLRRSCSKSQLRRLSGPRMQFRAATTSVPSVLETDSARSRRNTTVSCRREEREMLAGKAAAYLSRSSSLPLPRSLSWRDLRTRLRPRAAPLCLPRLCLSLFPSHAHPPRSLLLQVRDNQRLASPHGVPQLRHPLPNPRQPPGNPLLLHRDLLRVSRGLDEREDGLVVTVAEPAIVDGLGGLAIVVEGHLLPVRRPARNRQPRQAQHRPRDVAQLVEQQRFNRRPRVEIRGAPAVLLVQLQAGHVDRLVVVVLGVRVRQQRELGVDLDVGQRRAVCVLLEPLLDRPALVHLPVARAHRLLDRVHRQRALPPPLRAVRFPQSARRLLEQVRRAQQRLSRSDLGVGLSG
mmetsp:Transcript_10580/g.25064  ORF Transcript_10580/g.25064 Transcript_10580/m.25064 type:complete len:370 (-) Transcript_10580:867-1976(-)